jgi:hypothetical protein
VRRRIAGPSGRTVGLASTSGNGRSFARISSPSGARAPVRWGSTRRVSAEPQNCGYEAGFRLRPGGRCFDTARRDRGTPRGQMFRQKLPRGFPHVWWGCSVAKSGCSVAKSDHGVGLRVVVGWGRNSLHFGGNFEAHLRRSRDHPGFPTGETGPFGGSGVLVG